MKIDANNKKKSEPTDETTSTKGNVDMSVKKIDNAKDDSKDDAISKSTKEEAVTTTMKLTESLDIEHKNPSQKEKDAQINIQIKDGKLSIPDGPIQVLDSLFKMKPGDIKEAAEHHVIEDQEGN